MANLAVLNITRAGVVFASTAAAGGGDTFTAGDRIFFYCANGGGGSITVTFATPGVVPGVELDVDSIAVTVGAGVTRFIGPFPPEWFADPSTGLVSVTYSGVASVQVWAYKLQQP